jgi:hypothetical protein
LEGKGSKEDEEKVRNILGKGECACRREKYDLKRE